MKANFKSVISVAAIAFAVSLTNYCTAAVNASPKVVVSPPVAMPMAVPGSYVWDGRQYVGMVGNQYYYVGPGNVWVIMDPVRMNYFHGWARTHPNWRAHAIRNTRYRTMGPVTQPVRIAPPPARPIRMPPPVIR